MNKLFLFGIMLFAFFSKNYSQNLVINELNVSDFKIHKDPNIYKSHENDGPFLRITFNINNDTGEDIFLYTDSDNLIITFNYKGEKYVKEMIWESLKEHGIMKISSNSSKEFTTSTDLFLGTDIWKFNKYDYTLDLLEVLPTLKLEYSDVKLKIKSTTINSVIVRSDYGSN